MVARKPVLSPSGLTPPGKSLIGPTILVTAPLWWPLVSDEKAQKTFDALASPQITADWGSSMISDEADVYDPSGYHFGAIWPLFTGWASVADYQYHRPLQGYAQLRDNALLAHSGASRPGDRGYFRHLLRTDFRKLPAPNLVVIHGREPDPARYLWCRYSCGWQCYPRARTSLRRGRAPRSAMCMLVVRICASSSIATVALYLQHKEFRRRSRTTELSPSGISLGQGSANDHRRNSCEARHTIHLARSPCSSASAGRPRSNEKCGHP